jgi:hypothetical protein
MTMNRRNSSGRDGQIGWDTKSNAAEERVFIDPEADLLDQGDQLVVAATRGDRRAVGAIAIAFGPTLNDEAREALGPKWEQESADVLQEFFLALCEGELEMPPIRGAGVPWMLREVRGIARRYVEEREGPEAG